MLGIYYKHIKEDVFDQRVKNQISPNKKKKKKIN